jgi:Holin of 3TMs, for gene-transfer release
MSFLKELLGGLTAPIMDIVSEVVVDKDKKREIELKLQELVDKSDERYHNELMGQIEVNKVEAAHASIFVAGWRPFIGWTGGAGLAYSFVLAPFIEFVARANGYMQEMPMPDAAQLMMLVTSMLGVGAMRSYDKAKGTAALPKNVS